MNPECHGNGVSRQCDLRQDRNLVQISLHLTFPTPLAYDLSLQPCFFLSCYISYFQWCGVSQRMYLWSVFGTFVTNPCFWLTRAKLLNLAQRYKKGTVFLYTSSLHELSHTLLSENIKNLTVLLWEHAETWGLKEGEKRCFLWVILMVILIPYV